MRGSESEKEIEKISPVAYWMALRALCISAAIDSQVKIEPRMGMRRKRKKTISPIQPNRQKSESVE